MENNYIIISTHLKRQSMSYISSGLALEATLEQPSDFLLEEVAHGGKIKEAL